jgi:hypothetical protein
MAAPREQPRPRRENPNRLRTLEAARTEGEETERITRAREAGDEMLH